MHIGPKRRGKVRYFTYYKPPSRPDFKGSTESQQSLASIPTWLAIYYPRIIQFFPPSAPQCPKKRLMWEAKREEFRRCQPVVRAHSLLRARERVPSFLPGASLARPLAPHQRSLLLISLSRVLHLDHDLWRQRRHGVSQLNVGRIYQVPTLGRVRSPMSQIPSKPSTWQCRMMLAYFYVQGPRYFLDQRF